MIKLQRGPKPDWIDHNQATKTIEYIDAATGAKPSPWRQDDVIASLKRDCRSKCMYCEGTIDDVAYSAVEHIAPKEIFPHRVLDWENLGLACTRCNTNKGRYWTDNERLKLLNPYLDNPSDHLHFAGPMTVSAPGSTRGANTVRKLKFAQRTELVISKCMAIEELHQRIERWATEADIEMKALYEEDLREAIAPEREFAATLIAYARTHGYANS